ncbi:MAG: biotin--[acetyl-CoA-carboxylase] ligase [Betaproteobacteria bacterium]|jgi:BirA family biotin operon repressor/biotin-[acetyl-CoA-carboxylase] ligase|nr:biotin--[acetyl-CoA-carboxylase] ligase [Betaproteobacteria bacterium]
MMPRMWPCERLATIDSTQRELLRRLTSAPSQHRDPFGLWTTAQTQGIGSHGRQWIDSRGGLAMSLGWPESVRPWPAAPNPAWPLRLSLAVMQTLEEFFQLTDAMLGVKWPNDIMARGRKLGGVLVSRHQIQGRWWLIAGIGINFSWPSPPDINRPVIALEDLGVTQAPTETIVMALSAAVEGLCEHSELDDAKAWVDEFHRRDLYANQRVVVIHPVSGEPLAAGRNCGVIHSGALRLEIDGAERLIEVGELSLRGDRVA